MSNFLTPLSAGITRVLVFMNGRLPPRRIRLSPQLLVSKSIGGVVQKRPRPYQGGSVRYVYLLIICGHYIFVWVLKFFMKKMCFNPRLMSLIYKHVRRSFECSLTLG